MSTCCGKDIGACRACPRGYYCSTPGLTIGKYQNYLNYQTYFIILVEVMSNELLMM